MSIPSTLFYSFWLLSHLRPLDLCGIWMAPPRPEPFWRAYLAVWSGLRRTLVAQGPWFLSINGRQWLSGWKTKLQFYILPLDGTLFYKIIYSRYCREMSRCSRRRAGRTGIATSGPRSTVPPSSPPSSPSVTVRSSRTTTSRPAGSTCASVRVPSVTAR